MTVNIMNDASRTKLNMRELEANAKATATNHVIRMLQKPGQLEKVEQYKRGINRKKASVEALLKSAMQSQLDGVRTGLKQLQQCLEEIKEVETSLKLMNNVLNDVPKLYDCLSDVREENMKHSQYVTAMENLKHIFTVPESVEKTKQWINDGKLLHTHQCLTDLESSRDDLLFELHKLPNQSPHDKVMLKAYFADVETLSKLLEKQLKLIFGRTLNTVRKEPTVIVTALRIIEREEKADTFAIQQQKQTGFLAPGRPKKWRALAFAELEKGVAQRIEGTQVEERENNKLWLVTYLERTRLLILEDLRVVKTLCVPCFPPQYNIFDAYIRMYHSSLSTHLQEIIQNGLEGNEYVSLLSWILNTYSGVELMSHPDLQMHTKNLTALLPSSVLERMQIEYLANMESNYTEWMRNTLTSEKQEWQSAEPPSESNADVHFGTSAPIIIFQMIDQNLQVTNTISQELTHRALALSIDQVNQYGNAYRDGIVEFKNRHFEDRNQMPFYTHHMITAVNNCMQLIDLGSKLREQYSNQTARMVFNKDQNVVEERFQNLTLLYTQLRNEASKYLLEEAFLDLDKHFDELFTPRWLQATLPVDTICVTLEDYFQDYNHLTETNFDYVITEAQNLVSKRYMTAMLSKKVSFKTFEECQLAAKKISKEVAQMKQFFVRVASGFVKNDLLEPVIVVTEVLKCEDAEILSLDLHGIVDRYPDISEDQLHRLLYLRGDLPRNELRDKVAYIAKNKSAPHSQQPASIFKSIAFVERIINW